jgi:hypothetical protein
MVVLLRKSLREQLRLVAAMGHGPALCESFAVRSRIGIALQKKPELLLFMVDASNVAS